MTSPDPKPLVSVCVANYNGERLLADCLESVLAQHTDVEILVHDDASTDGSLGLLAARYPQVRVIASADNVGFCIANNRMADAARGEYLLLLNNDAALDDGALQALLSEARRIDGDAILTLPQRDWDTGVLVDRGCLLDPFYNPVPNVDASRTDVAYVIGACLWIPRKLWVDLRGFPDWMGSIAEDIYLCCVARLMGAQVATLTESGFRHRLGASFGGAKITKNGLNTTLRRRYLSERNKTFTLFVCTPGPLAWGLIVIHLATLVIEGLVLSTIKRDLAVFSRIYAKVPTSLFREYARLSQARARVQAGRVISAKAYFRPFTLIPRKLVMLCRFGIPAISK